MLFCNLRHTCDSLPSCLRKPLGYFMLQVLHHLPVRFLHGTHVDALFGTHHVRPLFFSTSSFYSFVFQLYISFPS